jgi:hypothetical protein
MKSKVDVFQSHDLLALFADDVSLLGVADAIAITQARTPQRSWNLSKRRAIASLAAVVVIAGLAFGTVSRHHGVASASAATSVTALHAYRSPAPAVSEGLLPDSVRMFLRHMSARVGAPLRIQEPVAEKPTIFLVTVGENDLCYVVVVRGAVASCHDELRQGDGSVGVDVDIVDGQLFVTGLAADDVTAISVSEAASSHAATVQSNVFYVSLPYNGGGTGPITLVVSRSDKPDVTVTVPGVPVPEVHGP